MNSLPHLTSTTRTPRRVLWDERDLTVGDDVVLDSGNTDATNTPATNFREGNVIVKRTSTGRYVEANDSNGDVYTPAVVSSAEAADTDWDGTTHTTYLNGDLVATAVFAGSDDTTSECATALNTAYAAANVPVVASGLDGAVLVLTSHVRGSLRAESTLATAYATAGGAGSYAEDVDDYADFLITAQAVDLVDANGTARHARVSTYRKGHFYTTNLLNLTAAARAEFERRGSTFRTA